MDTASLPPVPTIGRDQAARLAVERIRHIHHQLGHRFPTVGLGKRYQLTANDNWFTGFWPGMLWLAHAATGDRALSDHARALLPSFSERLDRNIDVDHDLGFLFTLSARAQWQLTGDAGAAELAVRAAHELSRRFHPQGHYIQAWGAMGDAQEGGRMIIDALMNIPLLWWAGERTGNRDFQEIALTHATTSLRHLVRLDGSTCHTFFFDQATGAPLGPRTSQGAADDSLWARGQAWAIYGFTLAAEWTGESRFADAARTLADCFLAALPASWVPTWDLRLAADAPYYLDSAAGAIAAGGLLRLARLQGSSAGQAWRDAAEKLTDALLAHCFETYPDAHGLLRHGNYDTPQNNGVDGYLICGDYFFLETLLALTGTVPDLWGPAAAVASP